MPLPDYAMLSLRACATAMIPTMSIYSTRRQEHRTTGMPANKAAHGGRRAAYFVDATTASVTASGYAPRVRTLVFRAFMFTRDHRYDTEYESSAYVSIVSWR